MNALKEPPQEVKAASLLHNFRLAVAAGHRAAVARDNASTQFLLGAYQMNGMNAIQAVTAAISTMGGAHAPIANAYGFLQSEQSEEQITDQMINARLRVPGFGNSFVKGEKDSAWDAADIALQKVAPELHQKIWSFQKALANLGKNVFPNAAIYTAALAILEGIPKQLSPLLVLEFRAESWRNILTKTIHVEQKGT